MTATNITNLHSFFGELLAFVTRSDWAGMGIRQQAAA
jgi:hypothetical protein